MVVHYKLLLQNKLYWCAEADSRSNVYFVGSSKKSRAVTKEGAKGLSDFCRTTDSSWEGQSLLSCNTWCGLSHNWWYVTMWWLTEKTKLHTRRGIDFMLWLRCENWAWEIAVPHNRTFTFLPASKKYMTGVGTRVWVCCVWKLNVWNGIHW